MLMNTSKPSNRRRLLIITVIVVLLVAAGAYAWLEQTTSKNPKGTDRTLTEASRKSMSGDEKLSTPAMASREYKDQLSKKDSMSNASKSDKIAYYNYLIQSAQRSKLCEEAEDAAKEMEAVDISSAFSSYFAIIRCYTAKEQAAKADTLRAYMTSNIQRLPQEEQEAYRMRLES